MNKTRKFYHCIDFSFAGGMVDLSTSAANNYQQRSSPSTSPGIMSNKAMAKQSPNSQQRQHNLRVMIPNCRGDMNSEVSSPIK